MDMKRHGKIWHIDNENFNTQYDIKNEIIIVFMTNENKYEFLESLTDHIYEISDLQCNGDYISGEYNLKKENGIFRLDPVEK